MAPRFLGAFEAFGLKVLETYRRPSPSGEFVDSTRRPPSGNAPRNGKPLLRVLDSIPLVFAALRVRRPRAQRSGAQLTHSAQVERALDEVDVSTLRFRASHLGRRFLLHWWRESVPDLARSRAAPNSQLRALKECRTSLPPGHGQSSLMMTLPRPARAPEARPICRPYRTRDIVFFGGSGRHRSADMGDLADDGRHGEDGELVPVLRLFGRRSQGPRLQDPREKFR